jgi:hypothetical protein
MMAKSKWFIPSLVFAGLFFVALSWWMSSRLETNAPGLRALARITYNSGEVFILHQSMTEKEPLTKGKTLYYLDTIETGPNGDATLEVDSNRIRILDNSLITLDQDNEKTVLILKRGDIQFESFGSNHNLVLSKNGQRMSPNEYVSILKRDGLQGAFPDLAPQVEESTSSAGSAESLSSEYIQDTLKRQIPAFDKCYKQLLRRTPGVVGQVVLTFTIERGGKISNSDTSTSTISDNDFKRCLTEVVRRVEFKSFAGDPITSTFPMSFE